mgnify:FL=1
MLSRRSFAKFCGLSTIPLFTGLEVTATPETTNVVLGADRFVTFCDFKMPEIAQVFTKTEHLEFPLDFIGENGKGDSIRLTPYMIQKTFTYDSKYKNRPDIVNRVTEMLTKDVQEAIEADMLHLLFVAGAESRTIFGYHKERKLPINLFGCNHNKIILSPEAIENRLSISEQSSKEIIPSFLLGKDQPLQKHMARVAELNFSGDIGIRARLNKSDSIVLTQLPHLPPMMGFNTSFNFNSKECKVTEIQNKKEGKELISIAYFPAMGVLDCRDVQLLDIET